MFFEIFKTGTHTSSNGTTKTYTEADLDNIVKSYNPKEHEAPIVIGHPKNNSPAFGWVESVKRVGNKLYAKAKDLLPEFVELLKKGVYKKRSISLDNEGKLVHVGFLGGKAPAVKGLADIKFSADSDSFEFANNDFSTLLPNAEDDINDDDSNKFSSEDDNLKDDSNDNVSDDVSDKDNSAVIPNKNSKINSQDFNSDNSDNIKVNSDNNISDPGKSKQVDFTAVQDSLNELKNTFNNFIQNNNFASNDQDIKDAQQRISELSFTIRVNEFELYLNEKLAYGTLTPVLKDKILNLINFFKKNNFSQKELDDYFLLFTSFVDAFPKIISFDDYAVDDKNIINSDSDDFKNFTLDKQSELIHKEAMKLVNSDNISYSDAINKIIYSK